MALAKGASIIEKHVTFDRNDQWEDYQSALGKSDFQRFVKYVKNLSLLAEIGTLNQFELQYRVMFKKTPVLSSELQAGHTFFRRY